MNLGEWNDLGLALAAILTAIGALVSAVFAWVKWRRELRLLRAELRPSEDESEQPETPPARAVAAPEPRPAGTIRDVTDSSHQLLLHLVNQVDALTQTDSRIEAWGKGEHQRLDDRLDRHRTEINSHEQRIAALERGEN